ncbi:MAG: GNAT family N-acetyltransferase [Patescibacteria group bacterium]|jgi:RimJ/RimL family protein N-acetyltransferase
MKPISKFTSHSGKEIEIYLPTLEKTSELLEFINRLTKEDTFLSLTGKPKTYTEEENWIKNTILNMKAGRSFACLAVFDGKIIGSSDVNRGGTRDWHVGTVGLMVDEDFRRDGLGRFLLEYVLEKSKEMGIKIAILRVFSDNEIAKKLYQKLGFKEYGNLPNGLYRKDKYSDNIEMYKEITNNY